MAFNKDQFAAAFLNQITGTMTKRREDALEYKERQLEASERNQSLINTRNNRASAAVSFGKEALQYLPEGVRSKGVIRTAMASGMTGVKELRDKLAKAHADAGLSAGERLSLNDVEAIINMPNIPSIDQSLIDMSLEQFAKKTYGAVGEASAVEDDTSVVGRLFGYGARDRVKEELRDTPSMAGMSVADINAAARMSEFNSLIPNAVMSFSEMETFTKKDSFTFVKDLTEIYQDAYNSSEADDAAELAYNSYIAAQKELGRSAGSDPITQAEIASQKAIARKAYAQRKAKAFIDATAAQYGGAGQGFFEQKFAMDQIAEIMDKDFVDALMKDYDFTPKVDEEDKDTTQTIDPVVTPTTEESKMEDVQLTTPDVSVDVSSLPTVKVRPGGTKDIGLFGDPEARKWDKQYGDRYNPDGTPIIVKPRPTDPEETIMVESYLSGKDRPTNAIEEWDRRYKKTHNTDGTPKQFKDD